VDKQKKRHNRDPDPRHSSFRHPRQELRDLRTTYGAAQPSNKPASAAHPLLLCSPYFRVAHRSAAGEHGTKHQEQMPNNHLILCILVVLLSLGCNKGVRPGSDLTPEEIAYIRSLGILDSTETILVLHSQSGNFRKPVLQAGNFISDKRIGSYWIDKDTARTRIRAAYYSTIDTLTPRFNNGWPAGNYIQVDLHGRNWFNVYVSSDSAEAWSFYDRACEEWRKQHVN
jgi:hypothetical protein